MGACRTGGEAGVGFIVAVNGDGVPESAMRWDEVSVM
jgi:hypothetical protein